jgi:hypothetical protein
MNLFESQLNELDVGLLEEIESQTSADDKRSLLALHLACRRAYGQFRWLEIGSHLGGSLQALVRDPACVRIDSIDPRPELLGDERMSPQRYPDNSTARMLELLGRLPEADLEKLHTYEAGTPELNGSDFSPAHVCFIDGEHTDDACAQDARFCQEVIRGEGLILFHDVGVIYRAVAEFAEQLSTDGLESRVAYLPDSLFAIEVGGGALLEDPAVVGRRLEAGRGVLWLLGSNDRYRALLQARRARTLRRLGLLPRDF